MKKLFTIMLLILGINAYAQLTINGKILIENQVTTDQVTITIINSTDNTTSVIEQKRTLKLQLEYDKEYIIIVSKQGYKSKAISVDTYCDILNPVKYFCYINLESTTDKIAEASLAGGIFFNAYKKEFDYYLK